MMGAFAYESTGGSFEPPSEMFRGKVENDEPVFEPVDMSAYIVPPTADYHLRLTGFSRAKEEDVPDRFLKGKENAPKTRKVVSLELEIASGRGKGSRFLWNFITFSLGMGSNPSHMGRIYKAGVLNGGDPEKGKQLFYDDLIGCEFDAFVNASDSRDENGRPKFATLSKDSIRPHREHHSDYDPFPKTEDVETWPEAS